MSFKRCYRTGNDDDAEMSSVSKSFHKQGAATLKVWLPVSVSRDQRTQGSHCFTDKKSRTFPGLSRTPMRNFPGHFQSPRMLKYKEKTLPSPPDPCPPSPPLPLDVGPFKSSWGICGSAVISLSAGSGAELQPKSNLVHFSLKIWHLVATILTILLRINWPNLVKVKKGKDVDLYSAFHAPGTPNAHTSLKLTHQTAI